MQGHLEELIAASLGTQAADTLLNTLSVHESFLCEHGPRISRAVYSLALGAVLFDGLLKRVPTASEYVEERRRAGERITFDHGAVRTIRFATGPTGALPAGHAAFARILVPLGYSLCGLYPLERLHMTGRSYAHVDEPELIPQYFVSELHVERFSESFSAAARRVFGGTIDPLTSRANHALTQLGETSTVERELGIAALPDIAAAFGCWHPTPTLADYRILLGESAEAAWIATEGNAFNHATDRVPDVEALAARERALNRPIKDEVEVSLSGRIKQTAYRAALVTRRFLDDSGREIHMEVPGSFYEFITREEMRGRDGRVRLDLRFDSSNAQGIFAMTRAAAAS
ncbi:MAG TPA: DUF1338 family protein [Steroidobacter sp.]